MPVTGYDQTFSEAMEREIRTRLQGDKEHQGLYRQIMTCPNWDTYQRVSGIIFAYEEALKLMREIARRMNEGEEAVRERRAGMN